MHKLLNCRVIRLHYVLRALGVLVEYFMRTALWERFVLIRNGRPHNAGSRLHFTSLHFTSLHFILPPPLPYPLHCLVSDISTIVFILCCYFVLCIIYALHVPYKLYCRIGCLRELKNRAVFYITSSLQTILSHSVLKMEVLFFPRNADYNIPDQMVETGRSQCESLLSLKPEILRNLYRRFVTLVYGSWS